jgi:hypothetical protein
MAFFLGIFWILAGFGFFYDAFFVKIALFSAFWH